MSAPVTLLVTGSRALADTHNARWWAVREILRALADLPLGATVLHGGARGPDVWGSEIATTLGCAVLEFSASGDAWCRSHEAVTQYGHLGRRGFSNGWSWLADPPPRGPKGSREWYLARDRAMVQWVSQREGERCCLALVAPWSTTGGTAYTARHARLAGIVVTEHVCPRDLGPGAKEVTRG